MAVEEVVVTASVAGVLEVEVVAVLSAVGVAMVERLAKAFVA